MSKRRPSRTRRSGDVTLVPKIIATRRVREGAVLAALLLLFIVLPVLATFAAQIYICKSMNSTRTAMECVRGW